jgi:hypothetical protein
MGSHREEEERSGEVREVHGRSKKDMQAARIPDFMTPPLPPLSIGVRGGLLKSEVVSVWRARSLRSRCAAAH